MRRTKIDMSPERQLVTHLITSTRFAREILPILNSKMLKTRYAQVVVQWVRDYYERFEGAPGKAIQDIYLDRKASLRDEEESESVAEFLQNLSDDAKEESNLEFHISQTEKYLKTLSIEQAIEEMKAALSKNEPLVAEGIIANYKRVGKPSGDGYSLLDNPMDVVEAFTEEAEIALRFPGALGKVVGPCRRGDIISFIAPVKRGKTWALLYASDLAASQRQRVAFFTLEMPKPQIIRRGWQAMVGAPKTDRVITMPYFAPDKEATEEITPDTKWRIEYKDVAKKGVSIDEIDTIQKNMRRMYRGGDCRFIPMAAKATTVRDIETVLDNLMYYDDYQVDVVVIDYADLLGSKLSGDYRHQLDDIWSNLRRLAQERNILVVTATQTNRAGLSGEDITPENVAEDMRKLAHVSKLVALNQSATEKEHHIMRWKCLLDRDESSVYEHATVLSCLSIGKFVLDSRLQSEMMK